MSNPITDLIEWLKKQDEDVQSQIAFLVSVQHPSFDIYNFPLEQQKELVNKFFIEISKHSKGEINDVGFALAFRAIFDFSIVRQRGTVEDWEKTKKMFLDMNEMSDENRPTISQFLSGKIDEIPELSKKWIAVCDNWKALKESSLSDEAINEWQDSYLISSHERHTIEI